MASVSSVGSVGLVPTVRPTVADRLEPGDLGRPRENFERRRALTGRQVVRIAPLAS